MHLYKIRKMKVEDLDQVVALEAKSFSTPWSRKSIEDAFLNPDNIYIVCEMDQTVIGYMGAWTSMGEADIMNIAVDEAYRRNGVGRSLMQSLEAVGKKMDVSAYFLEVRESNAAARKLYESMEFRNIGVRKHYYREPVEDAIIMSKVYRLEDEFDA